MGLSNGAEKLIKNGKSNLWNWLNGHLEDFSGISLVKL